MIIALLYEMYADLILMYVKQSKIEITSSSSTT